MRKAYDFAKGKRNPYARRLKQQVTIRIEADTITYFKELADELGIPYQPLRLAIAHEEVCRGHATDRFVTLLVRRRGRAAFHAYCASF